MPQFFSLLSAFAAFSVVAAIGTSRVLAAPAAPAAAASPQEQKLQAQYAAMLTGLQAEIAKGLPAIPEARKAALQQARVAVTKATAEAKKAQEALGKVSTAKALVDHANGKWLGGAAKGIAAAEAALKKATTEAERTAANKDLAKWQAIREEGLKALAERQAALTAAKADLRPVTHHPSYQSAAVPAEWAQLVWLAGTERSADYGGYLEGALDAAELAVKGVLAHRALRPGQQLQRPHAHWR